MTSHPQQDVCCLMGEPIAGNPTQYMLEKAFEAARLDWRFLTFEVPPLDLEGALRGARIFGFHGIMLAPPHRNSVIPYLQEIGEAARISGQVNCCHTSLLAGGSHPPGPETSVSPASGSLFMS